MNKPSTTPEQALRGELEMIVTAYTAKGHGATVADLIQSVTSGRAREEHVEFLFKYYLGLQKSGQPCSAHMEGLLIDLFRKVVQGQMAVKPDFLGRILKRIQEQPGLEGVQWIGQLKGHLERAVETRTSSTRRQVQAVAATTTVAPGGVDVTLANVPQALQEAKRDLLRETLMPFARQHVSSPEECIAGLQELLSRETNAALVPLLIDLSGQGRSLPHPLYLVAQALVNLYEANNPYVRRWIDNGQHDRLQWMQEGVAFYAAEHARQQLNHLLGIFQTSYPSTPSHQLPQLCSGLALRMKPVLTQYPEASRGIAQSLLEQVTLSPALEAVGKILLEQVRPLIQQRRLSPQATSALSGLLKKLKRIKKERKAAHAKAQPAEDLEGIDTDLTSARTAAQGEVKKAQREAQPQKMEGLLNSATLHLRDEVMEKDPQGFIDRYLRPALQEQGASLGIDVQQSSFKLLGKGTSSILVEVHDRLSNQAVAMRCDKQGLGDENSAQVALRGVALQSRLTHANIAKSLGFNTIRIPIEVSKRTVQVTMMYQHVENLQGSIGLGALISELHRRGQVLHPEAVRAFGYQVFSALEYCHDMGIVHRDLKPENIMITPPANWKAGDANDLLKRGVPKIVDFGSARDVNEAEGGATITKGFAGTAPYLAPAVLGVPAQNREPAEGDMYPMGIVLYELMSGQNLIHPVKHSHAPHFERNPEGVAAQQITYSSTIGVLQPGDAPIISHTDPHLEKFQGQQEATATLTGKQVKAMAENMVAQAERLSDPDPKKRPTAADMVAFFENPIDSAFVRFETKTPPRAQRALKKTGRRAAAPETPSEGEESSPGGIMGALKKLRGMMPF